MAYFEFHHRDYLSSIFKVTIIEDDESPIYRVEPNGFELVFRMQKDEAGWNILTKGLAPADTGLANAIGQEIEKLDPADMDPKGDPDDILRGMMGDDSEEGLDWTLEDGKL